MKTTAQAKIIRLAMAKKAIIALLSLGDDSINTVALVFVDGGAGDGVDDGDAGDGVDDKDGGDVVVDGGAGDGVVDGVADEVAFKTIVVVMPSSALPSSWSRRRLVVVCRLSFRRSYSKEISVLVTFKISAMKFLISTNSLVTLCMLPSHSITTLPSSLHSTSKIKLSLFFSSIPNSELHASIFFSIIFVHAVLLKGIGSHEVFCFARAPAVSM